MLLRGVRSGNPESSVGRQPITPQGGWDLVADKLTGDLARTPLLDPKSSKIQRLLVDYVTSKLALALGDRSSTALERRLPPRLPWPSAGSRYCSIPGQRELGEAWRGRGVDTFHHHPFIVLG
jgi:hypothetical protein